MKEKIIIEKREREKKFKVWRKKRGENVYTFHVFVLFLPLFFDFMFFSLFFIFKLNHKIKKNLDLKK